VFFSGLLLTETLFAVVLVWAWAGIGLLALRKRPDVHVWAAVSTGSLLLASILLRPGAVFLAAVGALAVVVLRRAEGSSLKAAGIVCGILLVGLSGWAWRNDRVTGEWIWLTTRGGISLYDGFRPGADGGSDLKHTKTMPEVAGLSEREWNAFFRERAVTLARSEPLRTVKLAWLKFARTWALTPNVPEHRAGAKALLSACWMTGLLVTAATGAWCLRRRPPIWLLLAAPVAATTLLHIVYVGSVRYRVPVMPMVIIFSAVGAARLVGRLGPNR
jgi:hypothetical protein